MWAVVIGVSKYRDPAVRPLQYAHADAQAFADYLHSSAAGDMKKNIRTLINGEATLAAVDDALNWLKTSAQEGDVAMLYFAGHGDVEVAALWQLGYLLTYDSPSNNFRNNAIRVEDLDLLAIELSSVRNVRTIFVLDACRAGTLAEGRDVPHEYLSKQKANEVRILSCKPDQKSLEGANWGGGRGVFSYHLIRGLQGLANDESNTGDEDMVTVEEITDYLKQTVVKDTKAIDPEKRQDPVIVAATEDFPVSFVNQDILAQLTQPDEGTFALADATSGGRGLDDSDVVVFHEEQENPIELLFTIGQDGDMLEYMDLASLLDLPALEIPEAFIRQLSEVSREHHAPSRLQNRLDNYWADAGIDVGDPEAMKAFNIKMAIALHDRGQEIINSYLRADPHDLEERMVQKYETTRYRWYPNIFKLILKLLPEGHPLIDRLKVKEAYFSGASIRILAIGLEDRSAAYAEALALQKKALALDPYAPYVHNELGILYRQTGQLDLAELHYKKAQELAPTWGLPFSNLCALYLQLNKPVEAQECATTALKLVPDYATIHRLQGRIHERNRQLLDAEGQFLRCIQLAPGHFAGYEALGYLYLHTGEFAKADTNFTIAEELKKNLPFIIPDMDADGFSDLLDLDSFHEPRSIDELLELIRQHPDDPALHMELGQAYVRSGQLDLAVPVFLTVIRLDTGYRMVYDHLAWAYIKQGQYDLADRALVLAEERTEPASGREMLVALLAEKWERWDRAEEIYMTLIENDPFQHIGYQKLGALYENTGRYEEAEEVYLLFQDNIFEDGQNELYQFYQRMIDRLPGQATWMLRAANLLYLNCIQMETRRPEEAYIGTLHGETKQPLDYTQVYAYYAHSYTRLANPVHRDILIWPNCCDRPLALYNSAIPYATSAGERADILNKQGDISLHLELEEDAKEYYRRALDYVPTREDLRDKLIQRHLARCELSAARDLMTYQDSLHHLTWPDHLNLIRMDNLHGDFEAAREVMKKSGRMLAPAEDIRTLESLEAQNAFLENDLNHALKLYTRNHKIDPANGVHAWSAARIYALQKDEKAALTWVEKAMRSGFGEYTWVIARDPWMNSLRQSKKWNSLVGN